jgi:hypothetical protein
MEASRVGSPATWASVAVGVRNALAVTALGGTTVTLAWAVAVHPRRHLDHAAVVDRRDEHRYADPSGAPLGGGNAAARLLSYASACRRDTGRWSALLADGSATLRPPL